MADENLKKFYEEDEQKKVENNGEKNVNDSINKDYPLKLMLKEYLKNPNPDKFMELFNAIKKGSKISVAALSSTLSEYKESKNFDLTNDEEQMCAILAKIIEEKVLYEKIENERYDEMTGRFVKIEDETYGKTK